MHRYTSFRLYVFRGQEGRREEKVRFQKEREKACGKEIPYKIVARRPGDIATCYADPSKAKKLLGFETEYDIEEMCEDGYRFSSQNPDGIK